MKFAISMVALVTALAAAPAAQAQTAEAEAETLFRQGKTLMSQSKFAEACSAFDASQNLEPSVSTMLNQANCREKNGQLATSWGLYLKVQQQTRVGTDEISRQLREVATDRATKLEPRLSTMTITVPTEHRVPGLEVLRDGVPIEAGAWSRALPVDGGTYKITARAPGNAEWSSSVTVAKERDAQTLEIPKLKAAAIEPASKPTLAAQAPRPARPRSKVVPLAFAGASIALAGGAVGFALWGDSLYDQSKKEANDAKQTSLWNSANTRRYVAEGMAAASLACAGVSVWLYVRNRRASERNQVASRWLIEPVVGTAHAGVAVSGRY